MQNISKQPSSTKAIEYLRWLYELGFTVLVNVKIAASRYMPPNTFLLRGV
jgi:hypothetical protein